MRVGYGKERKILADTFRATREMIGLSQPSYARLFEVERALVQELEEGQLPAALDHRLLKFLLITLTMQRKPEFIEAMIHEMNSFYGLDHIFEQPDPLIALFEQVLSVDIERWPWIVNSVRFRSKALKRPRLGSFLVLWGQNEKIHKALLKAIPPQTPALISTANGQTMIILPSLYLFLSLNINNSSNPVVKELEMKLDKREPIGLAIPRQLPDQQTIDALELDQMRMFAFSQDAGVLREAATK